MSLLVPLRKKKPRNTFPVYPSGSLHDLLAGEIIVAQATRVHQLIYFSERNVRPSIPVPGTLLCTNYRISFIPDPNAANELPDESGQCLLDASRHIPLGCVEQVNLVSSKSKKVLDGVSTLPKKLSNLLLVCKDVKKLYFSLKSTPKNEAASLVSAIGRHSHPHSVHLLFAFDYTRALKDSRRHDNFLAQDTPPILSFLNPRDWQRELLRLGVTNDQWRVSEANKGFLICSSLCPFFPCPTSFSDMSLENAASVHSNNRIPVWCWSHPHTGVSLTRGGTILVDDDTEAPDPNYRVSIAMARHTDNQVENKGVKIVNILERCCSVKALNSSFRKIRDLCGPVTLYDFVSSDKHWYGGVEGSGWLGIARSCLVTAKDVTRMLCIKRHSVMLLEESGCDLSCVVSSLVQLMVDPHYRSISGFESLIQKEWVALGHPFTTRHALTVDILGKEDHQEAPVFLMFLNCVWQLSQQFPSAFEFSEFFLLQFYDMVLKSIYSNFLFDSPKHRLQASLYSRHSCFFGVGDEPLEHVDDYEGPLLSAWGRWREPMTKEENERCLNPLYYIFGSGESEYDNSISTPLSTQFGSILSDAGSDMAPFGRPHGDRELTPMSSSSQEADYYRCGLLIPETSLCSLRVWDGFFFRCIPELGALQEKGSLEVQQLESRMVRDVQKMKEDLNELELSMGTFTTDLPSCIGEVVQARERELLADRRESVEVGVPLRPRLTASVYSYTEADDFASAVPSREGGIQEVDGGGREDVTCTSDDTTPVNSPNNTPVKQKMPARTGVLSSGSMEGVKQAASRQTSLAQFTDALYISEMEEGRSLRPKALVERATVNVSTTTSRSPVTKTRLRVVKSHMSDPVVAPWQSSPRQPLRNRDTQQQDINTLTEDQRREEEEELNKYVLGSELTEL